MWVNIEVIPLTYKAIFLPNDTAKNIKTPSYISFGKITTYTYVQFFQLNNSNTQNTFENPCTIKISDKLRDELLIPDNLIYKIKFNQNKIEIGPVIGLLLGNHNYLYDPQHMEKYSDRFGIYNKIGGLIYGFTPKSINWQSKIVYGLYYNFKNSKWEYGTFPLPTVVYRRNFHTKPKTIDKLIKLTNNKVFNSHRFTKYDLHEYLSKDEYFNKHVPSTEITASYSQIKSFIDTHKVAILKPVDLSRGRGICIIEKLSSGYKLNDYRSKDPQEISISDDKSLEKFFSTNQSFFDKYIIQKHISLAKINDSRFDIRVVMQKNEKFIWQCTGIECRVGGSNVLVTNISRGGYALTLEEALKLSFPSEPNHKMIIQQIDDLSKKLCHYLESMDKHFAELGMDIAIDIYKKLWIIEVNVFPSFKGFKKIDYDTYLAIRHTPLLYANALTEFGDSKNNQK
jgi:glutathione synthase/RimK-type ligase-like ATP-grasp enzyme